MEWIKERDCLGKKIIQELYGKGLIKTWHRDNPDGWTLVSGIWSPLYIQLRPICSYPDLLKKVGVAMGQMIKNECVGNKLLGIAMAGVPITTAISLTTGIPACFTRKMEGVRSVDDFKEIVASYGEHALIEGNLVDGDTFIAIDDLVTGFDSKLIALEQLRWTGKKRDINVACGDVAVLLDREQGAVEAAQKFGIILHSLIPLKSKGLEWLGDYLTELEHDVLSDYLHQPEKYQDPEMQLELKKSSKM
jgi:uridine monophosphate synthetase